HLWKRQVFRENRDRLPREFSHHAMKCPERKRLHLMLRPRSRPALRATCRRNTRSGRRLLSRDEDRLQRAIFRFRFCTSCFRRPAPPLAALLMPSQVARDTAPSAALAMIVARQQSLLHFHVLRKDFQNLNK